MRKFGDAKRFGNIAKGVLRHNTALGFAQDEANARLVVRVSK
jgi:cyanophycinase-like exopeptidase